MDLSTIQNVSAAALRLKGRTYPVTGAARTGRIGVPLIGGDSPASAVVFNTITSKSSPMPSETLAAVQKATSGIQKQQGLITYAKQMQFARESRFKTRYDLLI